VNLSAVTFSYLSCSTSLHQLLHFGSAGGLAVAHLDY